ncbi:hypothetical protein SAMN04487980_1018111 [Streptomyces sp. cf124]|uniref:hypothetical protein n=1 Tax=Streptomyces sp. cf124 TaxID=1761903 RepID=UPI0008ED51BD|nr:hypothetical protein [Streptomyces sp. cf124]SFN38193.1 hypothetical protein SAMN04487980_1018111 [Streptomyces sp. cf124]
MSGLIGLSGAEWQALCTQVLRMHHGADLVAVPDKGGDHGLEAYTLTGHAFQCYSPEEPLTTLKRYQKQRDKTTEDVGKFIKNTAKLTKLFGEHVKINRWIIMCPQVDSKDLAAHCSSQTSRVRSAALEYADPDIHVICQTMEDYEISYKKVVNANLAKMHLPPLAQPNYSAVDSAHVATMHGKLAKVSVLRDQDRRNDYVQRLLTEYLHSQEFRSYIKDHYTEIHTLLESQLDDLEHRLVMEFVLDEGHAAAQLKKVLEETEKRVRFCAPDSSLGESRTLAHGQVADWLMRCPLDFYDEVAS